MRTVSAINSRPLRCLIVVSFAAKHAQMRARKITTSVSIFPPLVSVSFCLVLIPFVMYVWLLLCCFSFFMTQTYRLGKNHVDFTPVFSFSGIRYLSWKRTLFKIMTKNKIDANHAMCHRWKDPRMRIHSFQVKKVNTSFPISPKHLTPFTLASVSAGWINWIPTQPPWWSEWLVNLIA